MAATSSYCTILRYLAGEEECVCQHMSVLSAYSLIFAVQKCSLSGEVAADTCVFCFWVFFLSNAVKSAVTEAGFHFSTARWAHQRIGVKPVGRTKLIDVVFVALGTKGLPRKWNVSLGHGSVSWNGLLKVQTAAADGWPQVEGVTAWQVVMHMRNVLHICWL